jgi:hypothetical protein
MANPVTEFGYRHKHLTNSGVVLTGAGILHTVTINRADTTAGATVTVYDGVDAGGVVIAIVCMDAAVYVIPATLTYDVVVVTGLYLAFSAAVSADVTVSYS